jgi:8-oxo-dGTP diphosphatase
MPPSELPDAWDGEDFSGAKLAALHGQALLTYRRDNRPDIPFPGRIDLPGGGREGSESPAECALRELAEEFGIIVPPARVHYVRRYALSWNLPRPSFFLAVELTAAEIAAIAFGDEGEDWQLMPLAGFLAHGGAIPHLQARLQDFLGHTGQIAVL